MSTAFKVLAAFCLIVLIVIDTCRGYNVQDANAEDEYYASALANLLKQHHQIIDGQDHLANGSMEKRGCIRRGGGCEGRANDCCEGNSCRCNLFGSNCRCLRMGLFQKLI
ncbi:hypothetical protein B4U79_07500 [Dinothrombium tinctorium]|uniref:Uncharacterized protein n=1 Tax=Dinothrombium tinctorium TaxID=1965070 RepID=A0A3S3PGD4_9ACAR|nr:hypothetical protein B4U79_08921 [Dinothrombium tinctorium]RWS09100.1 hypothetical protein B4U79_07500 [Dinothrombium tinctorium]